MPGDQGAVAETSISRLYRPLVFVASASTIPTVFCTAVSKMPGTTTRGKKRKADSNNLKQNTEKVGFRF
jgi:hypothetical protein